MMCKFCCHLTNYLMVNVQFYKYGCVSLIISKNYEMIIYRI